MYYVDPEREDDPSTPTLGIKVQAEHPEYGVGSHDLMELTDSSFRGYFADHGGVPNWEHWALVCILVTLSRELGAKLHEQTQQHNDFLNQVNVTFRQG